MYSVNCVMNPPLLRLLFKAKGFTDVGGFISQTGELQSSLFLGTKVRESTKKNNRLMPGGTQQSQSWWRCLSCAFYFDRSSFCCAF